MRKVIFELGLLAFCVSAVVFVLQGFGIFDTLGRAFIVFIGVVLTGAIGLAVSAWFAADLKQPDGDQLTSDGQRRDAHPAATYQQPAAHSKTGAA
jgi:hypothetical protein